MIPTQMENIKDKVESHSATSSQSTMSKFSRVQIEFPAIEIFDLEAIAPVVVAKVELNQLQTFEPKAIEVKMEGESSKKRGRSS